MALGNTITLAPVSDVPCIEPAAILKAAKDSFEGKGFVWADGSPGYDANGQPVASNGDGLIDVNCLGLVQWSLKKAGYDYKFFVIEPCYLSGRVNHKYYKRVYTPSALPGDIFYVTDPTIVVKESEWRVAFWHVGLIASELKQCGGGCFDVFHSMLPQGPISDSIKIAKGQSQTLYDDIYIGQEVFLNYEVGPVWSHLFGDQLPKPKLVGVYRPKCTRDVSKDTSSPVFTHTDPLIMDLSGSGIRTLGLDAGIYFDHNSNGFAEIGRAHV